MGRVEAVVTEEGDLLAVAFNDQWLAGINQIATAAEVGEAAGFHHFELPYEGFFTEVSGVIVGQTDGCEMPLQHRQ